MTTFSESVDLSAVWFPSESTPDQVPLSNDLFSFWKLPESWKDRLSTQIDETRDAVEYYLLERYLAAGDRRPPAKIRAYYHIKQLLPPRLRFRINSMAVRVRQPLSFPNWPCESALVDLQREWLKSALARVNQDDGWHIGFWPGARRCCIVLTHDVESARGLDLMERVADIEERHGFRSSWNLPLAQYEIDWNRIGRMRERGFEFGAHGLSHDGRLFRSRADFAELMPRLECIAKSHGLKGFRAPSTLRRAEWIGSMGFDYDSSFADTDPWEPQPGGTCSLFPFHLGKLIELPYTLPQDHTLIHLLHRDPLQVWTTKAQWITSLGGMILTLTHPDYTGDDPYLSQYEELLKRLAAIDNAWRATPYEVVRWWRTRSELTLSEENGQVIISGAGSDDAAAVRLSDEPFAF
jgi:peptidoglycan/xylan/chitin deacetylase (PgdA/CDA1 family)